MNLFFLTKEVPYELKSHNDFQNIVLAGLIHDSETALREVFLQCLKLFLGAVLKFRRGINYTQKHPHCAILYRIMTILHSLLKLKKKYFSMTDKIFLRHIKLFEDKKYFQALAVLSHFFIPIPNTPYLPPCPQTCFSFSTFNLFFLAATVLFTRSQFSQNQSV